MAISDTQKTKYPTALVTVGVAVLRVVLNPGLSSSPKDAVDEAFAIGEEFTKQLKERYPDMVAALAADPDNDGL